NLVIHLERIRHVMRVRVMLCEVEERVVNEQCVLEGIGLDWGQFNVRSNSTAAVHGATAVGELNFMVGSSVLIGVAVEVVIVERDVGVIALNQASAGGVVLGGCKREPSVLRERKNRLHQSLAKGDFARDQAAVVVLNGAGQNFRGGS